MKKLILCLTLCASTGLFAGDSGAASSSSSSSGPNSYFEEIPSSSNPRSQNTFEGPFADLSGIHKALKAFGPFLKKPHVQIDVNHNTTETLNQTIRHEKDSYVNQFGDATVTSAGQRLGDLVVQDLYHAIKDFFVPNAEAALQENIARLRIRQAENAENERETNIQLMQEIRQLISVVRTLNNEASKRTLSTEEQNELDSAINSLQMLRGIIAAAA